MKSVRFWRLLALLMLVTALVPLGTGHSHAQDDEDDLPSLADQLYVELNQGLIEEEAKPLARSEALDEIAQVIADELGASGQYSSVPPALAAEFDYPAWPDNSRRIISEPFNFVGTQTPVEVAIFLKSSVAGMLAENPFREVGIATSTYVAVAGGTEQNVYALVFGSRPNVIPVVINNGADVVYDREVELHLHNELMVGYETDDNTIQRVLNVKIANSEDELDDAPSLLWDENNHAVPWQLTEGLGEKSVWVEYQDEKGVTVRYETTVELADPETRPTPTPGLAELPITLILTYGGDTLTLQVDSELPTVNLQDMYFTWLDGVRAYQLRNADNLAGVALEDFPTDACIQIRVRTQPVEVEVPDCTQIFLEANEFTELEQVFWNPEFGSFTVIDGLNELGTCDANESRCELSLR